MLTETLKRGARSFIAAAALVGFTVVPIFAQASTGKIQGRVVDEETGEAIAAAQVVVVGTNRGNITNDEGYYFINEVPAGLRDIRAVSIGYRPIVVEDERILAGQTTTLNFALEPTAVEVEALVVEGERNPLVPRDQVSSKAIVTGEQVDQLPFDNAASIVTLQPGVISTNQGRTIRGSRPNEEAVYVDGVLVRRYSSGNADPLELPTNSLSQVDVTTGGFSARFSDAQSGVVNYTTRAGGSEYGGSASFFTDQLAPNDWRTGFNRAELSLGGPVFGDVSFFLSGTAEGQKYQPTNEGRNFLVPAGADTTFTIARSSTAGGATDSVDIVFPEFVEWDNGRTIPFNQNDEYNAVGKLSLPFGGGSRLDLSYYRNRDQTLDRGVSELYNPDGTDGFLSTADVVTLGGYFVLAQTAEQALALDLKASYQRFYNQNGEVDQDWLREHNDPALGFNFSTIDFLVDADDWEVDERLIDAVRSGVLPDTALQVFPGRTDLDDKQAVRGVSGNLRLNPYGLRRSFTTSGFNNGGLTYTEEENLRFTGNIDWQVGRFNRIFAGGELALIDARRQRVPLFTGAAVPALNEPVRGGLFIEDRLDLGDVVLEGGLRYDYFDPGGEFPRVPGFVFNVPDSLTADFVEIGPADSPGQPILERLQPVENCNGAPVCKNNFIEAETKHAFSPRLAVSFPVTSASTFRLSYGQNVQVPALQSQSFGGLNAAAGTAALFADVHADFQGGLANTNSLYGRDVELPRTVLFEAGYRQLFGEDLVVDLAGYSKTVRNGLTYRKLPFEDPNTGATIFINVLTNSDYAQTRGVDLRVDKRFGEISDLSLNYSYVDARGTGSDPFTYTALLLRGNTNLSITRGEPVRPPEVLLPLEQSRTHNFSATLSVLLPSDFASGATNAVLSDVGIFATGRAASGLPFTRLLNRGNGQVGPPTRAGLGGTVAESLGASSTPWFKNVDLRVHKGFDLLGANMRAFADIRNVFNMENTNSVYLETGTVLNQEFRASELQDIMGDPNLDDDSDIDGFDIAAESPENALNTYSLLQAEQRYGDGDGFFTVEEQRTAFGAFYDLFNGPATLRESNQNLRLGLELTF